MTDLYKLLGVRRTASLNAIRGAYRTKAKKAHPDAPTGSIEAFNALKLAQDILTDPVRRQRYDATGDVSEKAPDPGRGPVIGFLASVLDQVLIELEKHGANAAEQDVVGCAAQIVESHIAKLRDNLAIIARREKAYDRIAKRFKHKQSGENLMEMVVQGQISILAANRQGMLGAIGLAEEGLRLIKEHDFERQIRQQQAVYMHLQQGLGGTSTTSFFR